MSDDELFRAVRRVLARHTRSWWTSLRWSIVPRGEGAVELGDDADIRTAGYVQYPRCRSTADPEGDLAREIVAEVRWSQ